ncbi:MAG: alpha/beta fold hydrolase [Gammaproteobacteria bacterium]|nr:alpha/beta fold hydrolase [Gammaproteobacteria bacterium]MDJ0890659.1 alpha/beta fold hydrolase [Gammaproteobacteria bacterium]
MKRLAVYLGVAVLGFVAGVVALSIAWMGRGPSLQLWHTEELEAEFTAERAGEIRTFDDYRRLEDELARQLDRQIYAHVETGPASTLSRFSAGSAVDPRNRETNWNRSYELPADTAAGGVLLLHGMSDGPFSLRALGEALNRHGYWVVGLRLPGHGTAPSGLKSIRWEDMGAAVRLGMRHLASMVGDRPIHVVGYSTGAPLALDYALDVLDGTVAPAPASLVLISPAIGISPAAALASWKVRLARIPGLEKLAWTQILPEFDPFNYNSFTSNAGDQVHRLTRSVVRRLASRSAADPIRLFPPTLVFLSTIDATVSVDAVIDNLLEHLAPERHELVLFDINRRSVKATLLVDDPGPLTARLMAADKLPFHLTLITNESNESANVVSRRKPPLSADVSTEPLGLAWPAGVISLSHVALPFPPDDPLYGRRQPGNEDVLHLGQIEIQGERGLLKLPADWLLRLRHNPFYGFLEARAIEWVKASKGDRGILPSRR